MLARFLVGDVFDRMAELDDGSVDLILTSPPFLALRDYLPGTHPDKTKEVGIEHNPEEFIGTLLRWAAECRRVLAEHGSLVVELGDTYANSPGAGGDYQPGGKRDGQPRYKGSGSISRAGYPGWPQAKSLSMVPELFRVGLVYGIHPLTGEPSPAGEWRVRNVVRWCRPNPGVGRLGDRFRAATSDLVVACMSGNRWYDSEPVRNQTEGPPFDWVLLSGARYGGAHYAVMPMELAGLFVQSMCPPKVCLICGEPSRHVVETERLVDGKPTDQYWTKGRAHSPAVETAGVTSMRSEGQGWFGRRVLSESWTECECIHPDGLDKWRPGVVLDPFAGTGTTLASALGHGRDAIGIDIDQRNVALAEERIGRLWLEIDEGKEKAPA